MADYRSPAVEESQPDDPRTVPTRGQYVPGHDSLLPVGRSTSTSSVESVLPQLEADSIIDAVTLRRIMKNRNVKIIPLLICFAGLPGSAKKEALQELFKTPITEGFSSHHILATNRSNYEIACVYSTSMLYNFGFQSCQLARSAEEISYKVPTKQPSIYRDALLNKHIQTLLAHLDQYSTNRGQLYDKRKLDFVFAITRGAALINIWDITLNTNVFYFLRAFSGHLINSRMWLFADLNKVSDNSIEEVNEEEEGKLQIRQRPLDFLLRCMQLCKGVTTHKRPCTVFASHSGEDNDREIESKMKTFEEELQQVARQLNVTEFKDQTLPFNKKVQGNYFLLFLKHFLGSVYGKTRIPITWLFLRGALEHKEGMFMRKAELRQLAEECDINDEDFKEFCELFTSFGSIFDLSLVDDTSDIIIVKTNEFLSNLSKAFDNSPDSKMYTENVIITKTTAREIFGASQGETFMSVLALVGMVAVVPGGKYAEEETHEACYYMPCARKRKQERFMDKQAVRLLLNNRSPMNFVNFEVAFTNFMLKHSFAKLQLSTDENRTIIKCTDNNSTITMTFRGDETEIKVMPPSKKHTLCVVQAFKEIAEIIDKKNRGRFSYAFAIMCSKDEKVYHRLPHDVQLCNECHLNYGDWIAALIEEPIPEKFKFVTDFDFEDVIFVTKELVAHCDQEMLTDLFRECHFNDDDYKESLPPWLNVLNQLTKWITQDLSKLPNSSATKAELAAKLDEWSSTKDSKIAKRLHNPAFNDGTTAEEVKKLKRKVVDDSMLIAKLTKEKLQLMENLPSTKDTTTAEELEKLSPEVFGDGKPAKKDLQLLEELQLLKDSTTAEEVKKLKHKVVDDGLVIAKLTKEKLRLKEELQLMKDTTTAENNEKRLKEKELVKDIGIQFDYIVPSMDNLECLSDVNIASKKLFLIQGDRPQLLNWERYGLRIGVSGGSLSSTETAEVAVAALIGGQFVFPKNTVLVSAVYAVSVSRPLLKALRLEMQHCVDLSRGVKTKYLKFAIAPMSTPSLPYKFSIVDGGEFSEGKWYGSINRKKFSLVSIVGSLTNGGEEEEGQEGEGNGGDHNGRNENGGGRQQNLEGDAAREQQGAAIVEQKEEGKGDEKKKNDERGLGKGGETEEQIQETKGQHTLQGEEGDNDKEKPSTGVSESMTYAGIVYYEVKGVEDLVRFAAAKNLNALLEYVKDCCPKAEMGQNVYFCFKNSSNYIELLMDKPQTEPFTGWKIKPHFRPCRLRQKDINNFGKKDYPLPPTCFISVYGSPAPGTEAMLHYAIPLDGVDDPVTIFIHRSLRNTPHPSSASANTTVQTEAQASPSVSTDQQVQQPSLNPQLAVKAFRKQFGTLSKLLSVSSNRLAVAPELFSEDIITFDCYKNATEGSSKTEEEKSAALMISLMSTVSTQPELLTELINVLNRIEPFKLIATKLAQASFH